MVAQDLIEKKQEVIKTNKAMTSNLKNRKELVANYRALDFLNKKIIQKVEALKAGQKPLFL